MKTRLHSSVAAAAFLALILAPRSQAGTYYSTTVSNDAPLVYWNFDEADGNAVQQMPLAAVPITTENDLVPVGGATRVSQADIGGLTKLGNAAELNGANSFEGAGMRVSKSSLNGAYAVEYWMQVQGANSVGTADRQDYLINFGPYPGGDNSPAAIYDFKPDELELFGGSGGRTDGGPTITDTNWHHVLLVYYGNGVDGVAARVDAFVDGVQVGGNISNGFGKPLNTTVIRVGAAKSDGSNGFEGRLDEVAVYDLSNLADESAVSAKAVQMAADHYFEGSFDTGNAYSDVVLADQPLLYWNFDEDSGNALQLAPVTIPEPDNAQNDLAPIFEATRAEHSAIGSGLELGNTTDLNGTNYFQAAMLDTGRSVLGPPWAVEFWMQVQGANDIGAGDRQDYLANFGNPDNAPAFIYDYKAEQLEIYAGNSGRTDQGPLVSDTQWHHVLWVYYGDGSSGVADRLDAYLDGALIANVRNNYSHGLTMNSLLLFGAALPNGVGGFEGRLDELAIYDLSGLGSEMAVQDKVSAMAPAHYAAAFGDPGNITITITQQPQGTTAELHGTATFSVEADVMNAPPDSLRYQWLKNGQVIDGATNSTYTTPPLQVADIGTSVYRVRLSSGPKIEQSDDATLTVPEPSEPPAQTGYARELLRDNPFLYWSFDEYVGNALQRAPLGLPAPVTTENDLVPVGGAGRVSHATLGDGLDKLGNAADFNGMNFYQAPALQTGRAALDGPWAVEFWLQAQGANTDNRSDYLVNFGGAPNNSPAFIYDFKPDQLEVYAGSAGRTDGGPTFNDSNWHHVVWVFYGDGTVGVADRVECWLDGVASANVRADYSKGITVNSLLLVGAALTDGANGFEGRLDELAVYDLSGLATEQDIETKIATMVSSHRDSAMTSGGPSYSEVVLADQPFLYWSFDEADGDALQLAPVTLPPLDNTQNELTPVGANRVEHSAIGSGLDLGLAADFNGSTFFQATTLSTAKGSLNGAWAAEFWFQALGPNTPDEADRQDYLINFGSAPDNSPAFIFDFKPDQLEIFGGSGGRTDGGPTVADSNWHHLLWVFYGDGTVGVAPRVDAWLDGINYTDVRNDFSKAITVNSGLLVGSAKTTGVNGFQGRIDEFAIYDLSALPDEDAVTAKATSLVTRHLLVATNPPPALAVTLTDNQLSVSWEGDGYRLQENSDLTNPDGWTDVPGGDTSPVTVTLAGPNAAFYRLRNQ